MRGSAAAGKLEARKMAISASARRNIRSDDRERARHRSRRRRAPFELCTMASSMGHVFHRNPLHNYPVAVAGDGAYLYDREGRRYLDASGGAAVSCLGHSDSAVIEAIQSQLKELHFVHTPIFIHEQVLTVIANT